MKCRAAFSATMRPGRDAAGEADRVGQRDQRFAGLARARVHREHRGELGHGLELRCTGSTKRGVTSLGFTSTAQPASSAGIASMKHSETGKFHGLMMPTSPYGTYCER